MCCKTKQSLLWKLLISVFFWFYVSTKKSCRKALLPVPGFYGCCTALVESDPLSSWSGRKPQITSPPWKRGEQRTQWKPKSLSWLAFAPCHQPSLLLQGSVDILGRSLHEGAADGGARDGHLLRDGRERRAESLGGWAGHRTQLAAQRHHRVYHHLDTVKQRSALARAYLKQL